MSLKRRQPFLLDISGFSGYKLHQGFELQRVFDCHAGLATATDVHQILGWQGLPGLMRILARPSLAAIHRNSLIVEPHFHHWPGISDAPQDSYLVGYWQSEKYFLEVDSIIRSDFTFKAPLVGLNVEFAKKISQLNAISLHLRRGDYVTDKKTNQILGVCPIEYYQAATQHMAKHVERPHYFIFSDDVPWAKNNLRLDFPCHYIEHNIGTESHNDMHLMSLCQHHIIANSSFSWWGAWLNPSPTKIVVAPQQWFTTATNTKDLFPLGYVTL